LVPFLLKFFSLDATFKSVGDVNNVYAFQKKAILDVRVIAGSANLTLSPTALGPVGPRVFKDIQFKA
jgi:hypothetical protein